MPIIKVKKMGKQYLIEVPETELVVLTTIIEISGHLSSVTVKEIEVKLTEDSEKPLSYAVIFSLLNRLKERNLVFRSESIQDIRGSKRKIITWGKNFTSMKEVLTLKSVP